MYQPHHFREDDLNVQHALIRAHPLEHESHPEPAGCGCTDIAKDLTEMAKRAEIQELVCRYGSLCTE